MRAAFLGIMAFLVLLAASASACYGGYYCTGYGAPYYSAPAYYSYEAWDGYAYSQMYTQTGRYYSYYGPSYYGYNYMYPTAYYYNYYPPAVYYYAPYYSYYNYGVSYYRPGYSMSFGWYR